MWDIGLHRSISLPARTFSRPRKGRYLLPGSGVLHHVLCSLVRLFRRHLFAGQTEIDILNNNKLARFDATPSDFASLPLHTQDLLQKMLELDANKRISAAEALQHRVFASVGGEERAEGEGEGEQVVSEAKPTG